MKKFSTLTIVLFFLINLSSAFCQLEWEQISGPYGGYVNKIIKGNENDIIAIASSFAYKSSNLGLSWNKIDNNTFNPLDYFFFDDMIFGISRSNENTKNYIYRSTDNMDSWTKKSDGFDNVYINSIRKKGTEYYACTDSGVYKSLDNGDSWNKEYFITSLQYNFIYDIVFTSQGTIFLATISGLYRSTDDGIIWTLMNPNNSNMLSNIENIYIDNDDKIYVNTPMGMFRSYDIGDTWIQIGEGIIQSNLGFIVEIQKGVILVGMNWGGMFISTDFGDTWKKANNYSALDIIITQDGKFFAATLEGVLYSEEVSGTWTLRNQGINEIAITSVFLNKSENSHKDEIIVGSERGSIYKSLDNGITWNYVYRFQGSSVSAIIAGRNEMLFASSIWGGVARSSDYGDTWEPVNSGLDDPDVRSLVADEEGNLYAGTFSDIFKSTDDGSTWSVCLTQTQSMQCYSLAFNSRNMLFAGTLVFGVLRSTNNGTNWTQMVNGLTSPVSYLAINKIDEVFATNNAGNLYCSTNDGNNWTLVKNGVGIECMLFINDNDILAGVDQNHQVVGILRSKDNGQNWYPEQTGAENLYVYSMDVNSNGIVYAGSSSGIYHTLQSVVSVENEEVVLDDLKLFPNPANDFINISAFSGEIKIFDLIGNELISKNMENNERIDIRSLKSGVYFIRYGNNSRIFVKI